jgi:signal transduction histidine kinase
MMPKALAESGLIAAMDDMLHKSLGLSSIQYRLEHFKVDGVRFPERIEIGLYRVCQELINNIIKHSGASEVAVQLFRSKGWLIMIVEDNGRGFLHSPNQEGIGLSNVTSRIHTVDGEVSWEPGPQCGTVATIKVPVSD